MISKKIYVLLLLPITIIAMDPNPNDEFSP